MATAEDLEGYLVRLERAYERTDADTFLVSLASNQPPAVLRVAPPVVLAQVTVGASPEDAVAAAALHRRLLELNGSDLLHAAYALEGDTVVLAAALELDSLDMNELEAVLADVGMALTEHVPELRRLAGVPPSSQEPRGTERNG